MWIHKEELVSGNETMLCFGSSHSAHCSAVSGVAVVGEGGMRTESRSDVERRAIRHLFLHSTLTQSHLVK